MGKPSTTGKNRNILIAIDGSDSSKNALRQAIGYSKKANCRVTVLTVLPPYEWELEIGIVKNIKGIYRELGEKILSGAKEIAEEEGVQIETVLEEGGIHEAIIDVAESRACDLIVMGRRGLSNIDRAFMGSITARVIGYSPIDVLVIPGKGVIKCDNILLAVDGSKYSDVAVDRAISMAQDYGSVLKVLSVVDVPAEAYAEAPDAVDKLVEEARKLTQKVEGRAKSAGIKTDSFVKVGDPHEKIVDTAKELGADTICMGSHGRTGLKRLLMGSVTEKVIGNAPCPVLVVKSY